MLYHSFVVFAAYLALQLCDVEAADVKMLLVIERLGMLFVMLVLALDLEIALDPWIHCEGRFLLPDLLHCADCYVGVGK